MIRLLCKIQSWRGTAYNAHHYYVFIQDEKGRQIVGTKFSSYDEAKEWAINEFMKRFDLREYVLDAEITEALSQTRKQYKWKELRWFEDWWAEKVLGIKEDYE